VRRFTCGVIFVFYGRSDAIKGTWWVALGPEADVYNPDKMTALKQGGFIFEPAFGHHYDQARDDEVVVQVLGPGPVKTTRLENNDAR